MNARVILFAALLAGCSAEVEVQTNPVTIRVPVLSTGVDAYAEIAIDMPEEARGLVQVLEVEGTGTLVNPTSGTNMTVSLYASTQGTATPDSPFVFSEANPPRYFNSALTLLPATSVPAGAEVPRQISHPGLAAAVANPRLWIIVGNRISVTGLGDVLPLEIILEDLSFRAVVSKSFEGAAGGAEVIGL